MEITDTDRLNALKSFLRFDDVDHYEGDAFLIIRKKGDGNGIYVAYDRDMTIDKALDHLVRDMRNHPDWFEEEKSL